MFLRLQQPIRISRCDFKSTLMFYHVSIRLRFFTVWVRICSLARSILHSNALHFKSFVRAFDEMHTFMPYVIFTLHKLMFHGCFRLVCVCVYAWVIWKIFFLALFLCLPVHCRKISLKLSFWREIIFQIALTLVHARSLCKWQCQYSSFACKCRMQTKFIFFLLICVADDL